MFSVYPLAFALSSPFIGKVLASLGRRNVIIAGTLWLGLSWLVCGYLEYVQNSTSFIIVFTICRTLMGIGISASQTSTYAIMTLLYPKEIEKAVAVIEGAVGIGLAIGPGFGSLMYHFYGFKGPFFGLAIIYFIFVFFIKPCISERVETNPNNTLYISQSNLHEAADYSSPITYTLLLKNPKIVFALMSALTNLWQFTFIEPFFADYLHVEFKLKPDIIGLLFLCLGIGYAISCQIVSRIIPYFNKRRTIIFGLICIGTSTSFYGPSEIIGFNKSVWVCSVALFSAGLTSGLSLLPIIPEINDLSNEDPAISIHLNSIVNRDILNDHVSGLFNTFFAVGNTIGPFLGNYMYTALGWPLTCDFMALLIISFALIYLLYTVCESYCRKPEHDISNCGFNLAKEIEK